jgi:hypothetical protein
MVSYLQLLWKFIELNAVKQSEKLTLKDRGGSPIATDEPDITRYMMLRTSVESGSSGSFEMAVS